MSFVPRRYAHFIFGVIQSGLTSGIASAFGVFASGGGHFLISWIEAWLASWALMLPVVILAAPLIQRLSIALTREA
ncbi:MAG: GNAT family acetyltransferase [Rhizobiales bacterium 65-9]|nr:DUF2798 domain-containing protein [Hyphomicrobiales bacterium]OJY32896.1 MAG: GNAT family acetyltransferase [Rhizobiales bacterium 65-9]